MSASKDPENNAAVNGEMGEGANVDKIRDILFGSQMRDYEKRFSRMEDRLAKDAAALREDLKKRFDALESFAKQEAESLGQRLKGEKSERLDALKELSRELRDTAKAFEKKLSQMEDEFASGQGDLRTRILEQSKSLAADMQEKHRTINATLEGEVESLREDLTDRAALADLFAELAMRLKKEFNLPEK